jgi:hypothetical protein
MLRRLLVQPRLDLIRLRTAASAATSIGGGVPGL